MREGTPSPQARDRQCRSPISDEHAAAFRALNEAWLARRLRVEPSDLAVLRDPVGAVLERGGRIFMAVESGEPVGCVALLPLPDGGYELGRMAVSESARGGGGRPRARAVLHRRGERLGRASHLSGGVQRARAALSLYRAWAFGNCRAVIPARRDDRIDIWMERPLP